MTKKALSRTGLEPVPLGAKDIPSELPFILIMTLKKEIRERTGSWRMLAYQAILAFTPPVRLFRCVYSNKKIISRPTRFPFAFFRVLPSEVYYIDSPPLAVIPLLAVIRHSFLSRDL